MTNTGSVILWLVPSNALREQTYKALRNREHPYHHDLRLAGPITVIDLAEERGLEQFGRPRRNSSSRRVWQAGRRR